MRKSKQKLLISRVVLMLFSLSLLPLLAGPEAATDEKVPVKIGILALRGPEHCMQKWGTTAEYLTKNISGCIFTIVPLAYPEVHSAVAQGKVDFILTNPAQYVALEIDHGTTRIITKMTMFDDIPLSTYAGVIFCRSGRPDIRSLADLKNKTFMAVDETSFGGWLMAWRELKNQGIDPKKDFAALRFGHTQDEIVRAVNERKVDAGTVRSGMLENMAAEGKIRLDEFYVINAHKEHAPGCKLPFLHSTSHYPEWPLARLCHTSARLAEHVAISLIQKASGCRLARQGGCLFWTVPLNYQPVRECLKELRFGPYHQPGIFAFRDVFRQYWTIPAGISIFTIIFIIVSVYVTRLNYKLQESNSIQKKEIAEREQAEQAMRQNEQRMDLALKGADLGLWDWYLQSGQVVFNRRWAEMLGYAPDEIEPNISVWNELVHPEEIPQREKVLQAHLAGKTPFYEIEYRLRTRSGGWLWILARGKVVEWDKDGKPFRGTGTHLDISERKQAEENLRNTYARIESLLAAISSVLIGIDQDNKITQWNLLAEKVFNIPAAQAIGQSFPHCPIPWEWTETLKDLPTLMLSNQSLHHENVRFHCCEGKEGILDITVSPVQGKADNLREFLLIGTDVTERRILETQLLHSQKMESIGQLSAGIAHEINTPIQYVGDNTRFMQEACADLFALLEKHHVLLEACRSGRVTPAMIQNIEAETKEYDLEYLKNEIPNSILQSLEGVERVATIVRAMRGFAHPDASREKIPANINQGIENTITVSRNEWKYAAEMHKNLDPELPLVSCLTGEINQVILNIIVNAAHAIQNVVGPDQKRKGNITITTGHEADWAEIRITDTGSGIPPEVRHKIFDPFFTTKEVGRGTGQGLAISRSVIVEKHGGTLDFETEIGKGTTFIIRLPVKSREEAGVA